ncbi:MAG: BamA/TamA family outer membrane protein [Myxococcota bacterium]|nr:BamA/TamA family outer membrane protein [Myxococcota bacterium]
MPAVITWIAILLWLVTGAHAESSAEAEPRSEGPAVAAESDDPGTGTDPASAEPDDEGDGDDDDEWDPYEGMDRSGRIPAVEKDVEVPDRWRYIPEGRIMPGSIVDRFLVSTFAAPLFFRDEDIGVGGGFGFVDIDFRNKRRREFAGVFASYTSEGQQAYGFTWRRWLHTIDHPKGGVLQEERSFFRIAGGYSKTLTRRFFGFGADSRESNETSYEDELFDINVGIEMALPDPGSDWILSAGFRGELHELAPGAIDDDPTTDELFPDAFFDAETSNLGYFQLGLHWDTRDSQANAYGGWRVGAAVNAALLQRGGDLGAVFALDAQRAFTVPPLFHSGAEGDEEHPPTDSLVFQFETATTAGDLPFFALPSLGGSERLRGYIGGRYRDRSNWYLGAEWRLWVIPRGFHIPFTRAVRIERIGLTPFVEAGSVADDWTDLFSSSVRASYGIGLRIGLERQAIFRVDLGFANEGPNLSARFGLAF